MRETGWWVRLGQLGYRPVTFARVLILLLLFGLLDFRSCSRRIDVLCQLVYYCHDTDVLLL